MIQKLSDTIQKAATNQQRIVLTKPSEAKGQKNEADLKKGKRGSRKANQEEVVEEELPTRKSKSPAIVPIVAENAATNKKAGKKVAAASIEVEEKKVATIPV